MNTALTVVFWAATYGGLAWLSVRELRTWWARREPRPRLPRIDTEPRINRIRRDPSPQPRKDVA